jgi:glycosyltransferase involved in cell wall biosynthesis
LPHLSRIAIPSGGALPHLQNSESQVVAPKRQRISGLDPDGDEQRALLTEVAASNPKPNKKIAVIGLSYPFRGGISHYSTLLVRELRNKYAVLFLTLNRQYPAWLFPGKTQYDLSTAKLAEENHAIIDSINPLTWIKALLLLKKEKVDLLVIQWWNPFFSPAFGTIANLLPFVAKTRVCFLCHNVLPHESSIFDRLLAKYAFWRTRHFLVHSDKDRQVLLSLRPGTSVRRNHHPTYAVFGDLLRYAKQEARSKLKIPADKQVILFFGMIRPYKGLEVLLYAMQEVARQIDCLLMIVGEFYEPKEKYDSLIRQLGLESHVVVFDQYVKNEEVSLYFCASDVVVLPYIEATQSGIVQIAFGLNKPVITTNVGGLPEAVEDGKTGFVVDPQSPDKLAQAILKFYAGDYETKFSQQIKQVSQDFSWHTEVSSIERFLLDHPT